MKEMQVRATKIAEVLQDNMSRLQNRYGGIGSSRFIRYIDNITMENVWVVDENKNCQNCTVRTSVRCPNSMV